MIILPKDKQYVLAHLTIDNWHDSDDPKGNRYWVVVKFRRGLSLQERDSLADSDPRKGAYKFGDQEGNNKVPYEWDTFGSSSFFGQEVDYWEELP
jgi:hypothetical protein